MSQGNIVFPFFQRWAFLLLLFCLACREQPSQPAATAVSLAITTTENSVVSGNTQQLQAVSRLSSGETATVTADAVWSVTPGVAGQVLADGRFLAFSNVAGRETVQAEYRGLRATLEIEVVKRARTFGVAPVTANLAQGGVLQMSASAQFEDGSQAFVTDKVKWSLVPGTTATIDSTGMLRALAQATGEENVFARYQNQVVQSKITIQASAVPPFEMVTIPAGSFIMGDDAGPARERPAHEVQIDAFQIGKYEITTAQYVAFLNAASARGDIFYENFIVTARRGRFTDLPYLKLCPTSTAYPEEAVKYVQVENLVYEYQVTRGYENYPMVRLTWYGAAAFCEFYGLRLPTEAEWEMACRSGQQLEYGTQDGTISPDLANYEGTAGADIYAALAPVGSFPPNPYGLYDMAGNAAEFVFDIFQSDYYAISPASNPHGPGPANPLGRLTLNGQFPVMMGRGGSWIYPRQFCRATSRNGIGTNDLPDQCMYGFDVGGVRVARSLP